MQGSRTSDTISGSKKVPEKVLTRHNPQLEVLKVLMGREASHEHLQDACLAVMTKVDTNAIMKGVGMESLPLVAPHMLADTHVFRLVHHFVDRANDAGRQPFIYLDLTRSPPE